MVRLPDDVPDSEAHLGVPVGPPSIASLDLPEEIEVKLHNELYSRKIFRSIDFRKRRMDVVSALQRALKLKVDHMYTLYLDLEKDSK